MFIEPPDRKTDQLRRSAIALIARSITLLRSFKLHLHPRFYKYSAPMALAKYFAPMALAKYFAPMALTTLLLITCGVMVMHSNASGSPKELAPNQSTQSQMQFPEGLDYSKFQHNSRNHSRLPCLLCHRRDSNAAVPKRPGGSQHLPCAGCHAQQFASSDSPICTICHTDPKSGAVRPFPSRLMSFGMKFDHARHVSMGNVGCATCHKS